MNEVQRYDDERIRQGITELQEMIRVRFTEAAFTVFRGDDPEGVYLQVTVDIADTDEVVDAIIDRLLELQVDEELPLYVVPVRPARRSLEDVPRPSDTRKQDVAPM